MKILTISAYGFQKLLREKVIFSFAFIAVVLILISLLLGAMSFDEQIRFLVHFGSAGILFSLLGISLIYGSTIIQKEIDSQTILLTLARPLSRSIYFIGQWLALVWVIILNGLILSCILFLLTEMTLPLSAFVISMLALLLQVLVVLTISMFFSMITRPVISFFAGLGIYLAGHWTPDLIYFAQKSKNDFFISSADVAHQFFPQLYRLNIQSYHLIQTQKFSDQLGQSFVHGFGWLVFFLILSLLTFRRKDLV